METLEQGPRWEPPRRTWKAQENEGFWNSACWRVAPWEGFICELAHVLAVPTKMFFFLGRETFQFSEIERERRKWKRERKRERKEERIVSHLCFNCMLNYCQRGLLTYVFTSSLHFFNKHISLWPYDHFSGEVCFFFVLFYFLIFVTQIKSIFFFSFFPPSFLLFSKAAHCLKSQQIYHPPEIDIIKSGLYILLNTGTLTHTHTQIFHQENRINSTLFVVYSGYLIIWYHNSLSMAEHIFLQHYFLIVL